MISKERGTAYVYTYPYWIYVDPKNPPGIIEFKIGNNDIRIFPPFRVAPWNSVNMPRLEDKMQIPLPPNKSPNYDEFKIMPCPIGLPHLNEDGKSDHPPFLSPGIKLGMGGVGWVEGRRRSLRSEGACLQSIVHFGARGCERRRWFVLASFTMSNVSAASSSDLTGSRRCNPRLCPKARQARRSDTSGFCCA